MEITAETRSLELQDIDPDSSRSQAEDRYARFVLAGIHAEAPWSGLRDQIYLRDEAFVDQMKSQIARSQ